MSKKVCDFCNQTTSFGNPSNDLKDGCICSNCTEQYNIFSHASQMKLMDYLQTITVQELKDIIKDPEKVNHMKIYHGYKKHLFESDEDAIEREKEKLKKFYEQDQKKAKIAAESNEIRIKYNELLPIFEKESTVTFGPYLFDDKRKQILKKKRPLSEPEFFNYSDIISFKVNQDGHNETKHHGITRAVVGGALAGGVGAIVGATTGGKQTDYIDHLGLIITLKDGSNFEIVFIRKIENIKSDSLAAKGAIQDFNTAVSKIQSIIANNNHQKLSSQNTQKLTTDSADEIRKFKKLADDGIITQEEFEAKKKQLLGL